MAETLFTLGIVCMLASGVGLICTVFLFFRLRIRSVIAEFTGKTARDAIRRIRTESTLREHGGRSLQSIIDAYTKDSSSDSPEGVGNTSSGNSQFLPEKKYNLARTETGLLRLRSGLLSNNDQGEYAELSPQYQITATQRHEEISDEITEKETARLS